MKLTPWYPGHIKPVRKRVYMQYDGLGEEIGYQYWNGNRWGVWETTVDAAYNHRNIIAAEMFQNDKWRGVLK
jgi:hypothetical protein